jgi:hypothetical protein
LMGQGEFDAKLAAFGKHVINDLYSSLSTTIKTPY